MTTTKRWIIVLLILFWMPFITPGTLLAQGVQTGNSTLATRVAPGESLPLTIRLTNFGSSQRTDVTITYEIFDAEEKLILSQTETVAVETTASFIKQIILPNTILPGVYTARTSILYVGQDVPATASQQFSVENKIFGVFISDAIVDLAILVAVAVLFALAGLFLRRYRKKSLFEPHEYTNIPKETRIYYEILSDTIQQMRFHEGDKAVSIASKVPGLTLNLTTGRVLTITEEPADVIAAVVSSYQKSFGKKLNLAFVGKKKGYAIVR